MNLSNYRFTLASSKLKKLDCPYCGAKQHWQRYIDNDTKEPLPMEFGRCDNVGKCGKFVNPYQSGYSKMIWEQEQNQGVRPLNSRYPTKHQKQIENPPTMSKLTPFDLETYRKTHKGYDNNTFIQNLLHNIEFPFDKKDVEKAIEMYGLGTIEKGEYKNGITFPFIDIKGNVRVVQVKKFDEKNHSIGKPMTLNRLIEYALNNQKKPLPKWLEDYNANEGKFTCFFGEHLLKDYPNCPIALVEAPKTAIYCWLYFQNSNVPIYKDCVWLAVGAKGYLKRDKINVLAGREVYVLPDLSKNGETFKEWESEFKNCEELWPGTRFILDDILEEWGTAEQREDGADIADILKFDWKLLRPNFGHEEESPITHNCSKNRKADEISDDIHKAATGISSSPTSLQLDQPIFKIIGENKFEAAVPMFLLSKGTTKNFADNFTAFGPAMVFVNVLLENIYQGVENNFELENERNALDEYRRKILNGNPPFADYYPMFKDLISQYYNKYNKVCASNPLVGQNFESIFGIFKQLEVYQAGPSQ